MPEILQGKAEDLEYRGSQLWLLPGPCRCCAHMHETPMLAQTEAGFKYVFTCKNIEYCERTAFGNCTDCKDGEWIRHDGETADGYKASMFHCAKWETCESRKWRGR